MDLQKKAMIKALVTRSARGDQLLRFLSPELAEEVQGLTKPSALSFEESLSATKWLDAIHYSWFLPHLDRLPKEAQATFLTLLPKSSARLARHLLGLDIHVSPPSHFATPFLAAFLKEQMQTEEILSVSHLPQSEMNLLLSLKKRSLLELVDLLGIHDLAADMRQIVDKELIGKINGVLTSGQLQFLAYCSKQPLKWAPPKMGLQAWDGSQKQLLSMIHQRGLARLARSCASEHPSLRWHLLHRLDTGRANFMKKVLLQRQDPTLIPYFQKQVLHILKKVEVE